MATTNSGPYGQLTVPPFPGPKESYTGAQTQHDYFKMVLDNIEKGREAVGQLNDTNQAALTAHLERALGKGWGEAWGTGRDALVSKAKGEFTEDEELMYRNMLTAQAQRAGLQGSGASLNLKVSGMGKAKMQMQAEALRQLPGYLQQEQGARVATPTRVNEMFIPIQQFAAEKATVEVNQWRAQFAAQQAAHTAQMANTAYNLQKQQAETAQRRSAQQTNAMNSASARATQNAVANANNAAYAAGMNRPWGMRDRAVQRGMASFDRAVARADRRRSSGLSSNRPLNPMYSYSRATSYR